MMKQLFALFLLLFVFSVYADPAAASAGSRPDPEVLKTVRKVFPGWKQNSAGRCAVSRSNGLWAWKVILERAVDPSIKSSYAVNGKGYIIIVMVPDIGVDPGKDFIRIFDWRTPGSDLHQETVFLGRGHGYYWYMKSDVARLEYFHRIMRLTDGVNIDKMMADALNVKDYKMFSSRTAAEYFRNKGPHVIPLILRSMKVWQQEEKELPVQHLVALKLTGSETAGAELMKIAASSDLALAHQALELLVEEPWLGTDSFYRRALPMPEYTGRIIRIFLHRNKADMILPRLKALFKAPKTIKQYSEVLAALRKLEKKARKDQPDVPEFVTCNDIMILMIRIGDTPDTLKYVPVEAGGSAGTPTKLAEEERRRIEPHLEMLRKSKDHEAVFAGAIALATFSPPEAVASKEYSSRVRRVGMEILRMLPSEFVFAGLDMLTRSLTLPREQSLLRMVRKEYGRR